MQPKISAFFRTSYSGSPATQSSDPPLLLDGDDNDLAIWERKEHQYFNTYCRRAPNSDSPLVEIRKEDDKEGATQLSKRPVSANQHSKPESKLSGKTIIKNKKRSYAQFHLELGQSDFLFRTCSTCGMKYTPGDEDDEKTHKAFHKDYTHGIRFKGWCNERIINMPDAHGGRIIMVLDSDPPVQRNKVEEVVRMMEIELGSGWIYHKICKVFMFILSQKVVGCLLAEPIEKAFKVFSDSVDQSSDDTKKEKARASKLHFGDVSFHREIVKRVPSLNNNETSEENTNGAIYCEEEAVAAACGIRAIWVSPANRRKHIATQLLDSVRKSLCAGFVLERSQLAFSQPTSVGKALATKYFGSGPFLVYKSNNLNTDGRNL